MQLGKILKGFAFVEYLVGQENTTNLPIDQRISDVDFSQGIKLLLDLEQWTVLEFYQLSSESYSLS